MNFSDLIQQSSGLVKYSPTGDLVAVAKNFEVKVMILSHKLFLGLRNQLSEADASVLFRGHSDTG